MTGSRELPDQAANPWGPTILTTTVAMLLEVSGSGVGWSRVCFQVPDQFGLIDLNGTVVAPRPFKPWRERSNAGGERRR